MSVELPAVRPVGHEPAVRHACVALEDGGEIPVLVVSWHRVGGRWRAWVIRVEGLEAIGAFVDGEQLRPAN